MSRDVDILLIHIPKLFVPSSIAKCIGKLNAIFEKLYRDFKRKEDTDIVQVTDTGLLSIASYLEENDFSVEYFWPNVKTRIPEQFFREYLRELETFLCKNNVKIVGAGPYTYVYPLTLAIFRFIKRKYPNIITILGGQHATFMDIQTLNDSSNIDIIVRGEGEKTVARVAQILLHKKSNNLEKVLGITFRKDGEIKRNSDGDLLSSEEIPPLAYHLLPNWVKERKLLLNIPTGRGCHYNCTFCTEKSFWKRPRLRSSEAVLQELDDVCKKYKVHGIRFADDTFTYDEKFVATLARGIKDRDLEFQSQIWTRIDHLNENILNHLKKIGTEQEICIGIESSSKKVLKEMRKGISFDQIINTCSRVSKEGFLLRAFWMIGHPGSYSEEEMTSYIGQRLLMEKEFCMLHEISVFTPYPGLDVFFNPEKYGVKILTYNWSRFIENPHPFPPVACLKTLGPCEIYQSYVERYLLNIQLLADYLGYSWSDIACFPI